IMVMLSLFAYCGIFGCLSFYVRRTLVIGIAYIGLFEGLLSSIDFVARRLTVMYYFRVLSCRWVDPAFARNWALDLETAPSAAGAVFTLLMVGVLLTVLAAHAMTTREFRLKTPEGT